MNRPYTSPVSLLKSASTVSLFTLASRITGLVRDVLFASVYGVSPMTDAFYVAFRIPNLFRRVFGEGAFSQAFVPVLSASRAEHGEAGAQALIDHVATLLTWTLVLVCVAGVVGAPLLVWALASGFHAETFDATVVMTRWMFPYIGFMSLVALAGGILNTWRKFAAPAAAPVLLNVALILAIVFASPWFGRHGIEPIYSQCIGVMVGGVLQLGLQLAALKKLAMLPRLGKSLSSLRTSWADPGTRRVLRLMGPALLGVSVAQISLLINTQIASHLVAGSVTWITNADRLMEFPTAMLGVALGVVLMPQLAQARASGNEAAYSSMLDWGLRLVVLLAAPCAVGLLLFARPLVAALFHYRAFTALDVDKTAAALMNYGVGLLGIIAIKVLAPGFYARQDTATPMRIAAVVLVFVQLLNVVLVPRLQHAALTLSISLGALANGAWLLVLLVRRGSYRPLPGWRNFLLRVGAASTLLALFLAWGDHAFDWIGLQAHKFERIGLLAGFLCASAAIYFIVLWVSGLKLRQMLRPTRLRDPA